MPVEMCPKSVPERDKMLHFRKYDVRAYLEKFEYGEEKKKRVPG